MPRPTLLACAAVLAGGTLCLVAAYSRPASGEAVDPPGAPALAGRIREVTQAIRSSRDELRRKRREHEARREALERQVERLRAQASELEVQLEESSQRAERLRSEMAADRDLIAALERAFTQLGEAVLAAGARLQNRIAAGIPARRKERAEELGKVIRGLAAPDAVERARSLPAFWSAISEELRLLATRELWNDLVPSGEDRLENAYLLRLGILEVLYVTEDGTRAGRAGRSTASWREASTSSEAEAIREALRIFRRRAEPQLLEIPLEADPQAVREESPGTREERP